MFRPSDPHDKLLTQKELEEWEQRRKEHRQAKRRETIRFWITTVLSGIAALAAIAGVIIQLVTMR